MPAKLLVFLSHRSDDNPLVKKLVPKLRSGLAAAWPGADLLVDLEALRSGQDWNEGINRMMWRCSAALVLLTPRVVSKPDWVRREINFLTVRAQTDPLFRLWIAVAPGVTDAQLAEAGLAPARLDQVQHLRTPLTAAKLDKLVEELCGSLEAIWAGLPDDEPITDHLEQLLCTDAARILCRKLAERLQLDLPPHWGTDQAEAIAAVTARCIIDQRKKRLALDALVKGLYFDNSQHRVRLIRWLAPLWLTRAAAERLREHEPKAGVSRSYATVGICGKQVSSFTALMHVLRAYHDAEYFDFMDVAIAVGGDLFGSIRKSICCWARARDGRFGALDDDQIVRKLRDPQVPLFVPLETAPDPGTCADLLKEFPCVLFIAPRIGFPDDALPAENVAFMQIPLDPGQTESDYLALEEIEYLGYRGLGWVT